MVVLGVSIMTKSGKVLVSRQFVDMSRIRVEGLLSAFPKLVGSGKQHTYIETENVRYVYQPIELLYLLVITNRQSNILEDLETLRLLSKLVPEYSLSLDEDGICEVAFELLFAFDEVITLGHKENVTVEQIKQYCEMDSQEEKVYKSMMQDKINSTKDVMKRRVGEIEKNKNDKRDRGLMSLSSGGSGRLDIGFNDLSISGGGSGFGSGGGFGLSTDVESISSKYQVHQPSSATAALKVGMQLGKSKKTDLLLESLKLEGEPIVEDVQQKMCQSRAAAPPPTDPITLTVEEKLDVTLKRDGGVGNFDLQGTLSLQILSQEDGLIRVQIETGGNPNILFKTHPNMNKELFSTESILGLRDPSRPFPTGPACDAAGAVLLKWRMQTAEESMVPLTVNCWPSVSGYETSVSIEYEASSIFDLCNVLISVPLPALREAPNIRQIDGESRYDPRKSVLDWSIVLIDNSNRSGSMEFVVPAVDSSVFYPISVRFSATNTFSDLKVTNIIPLRGGGAPKFSQGTRLITENYQVV